MVLILDENCVHNSNEMSLFKDDFICRECGKQFMSYHEWIYEHYNRHDSNNTGCNICDIINDFNKISKNI